MYGGGYTLGSKTGSGDPAGLVMRSKAAGRQGVIYVAMNYRLGAFGWLSGPTFSTTGGTPNAGLYDQRFALQWVQEHIASFGGDPNRVTVSRHLSRLHNTELQRRETDSCRSSERVLAVVLLCIKSLWVYM